MTGDDDYLRELLFEMEAGESYYFDPGGHAMGPSPEEMKKTYHCMLAHDAGLVAPIGDFVRLTNHGHDFIEAIRQDTVWNRTKEITSRGGAKTLAIMFDVAVGLAKEKLKEKTGLDL